MSILLPRSATQVTSLLRAYVTRLDSLGKATPRQEGPLSGCQLLTQEACNSRQILWLVQLLGKDIRQLRRSRDADQFHVAILGNFMGKLFPDVNVLGILPVTDDFVCPFNARSFVLVHTRVGSCCAKPMCSRRLQWFSTTVAAIEAE
jgi:hypothetical protein